jgi:hypothetical protein
LVNQAGSFSGEVEIPAGPGFVTVEAPGAWSLRPAVAATTTVATTALPTTTTA